MVVAQQNGRAHELPAMNVPRPVLDAFGGLVADEDEKRTAAAMVILQHVQEVLQGEGQKKETPAGVQYIVRRLVGGLASPRLKAREGYFSALCYLLRLHPTSFSPQFVLSLLTEKKSAIMKNVTKDEARDQLLGELLLCGAVVRSGRAVGSEVLQRVVNTLCAMRSKKSYLDITASQFLVNLIESCEGNSVHAVVWESLQAELKGEVEKLSPSQLWLRLVFLRKHRESPPAWLTATVAPKNHVALILILMKTLGDLPKVHPVVEELVTNLASQTYSSSSMLVKFWRAILQQMQSNTSPAKLHILFQLLRFMVPLLKTVSQFREVFTPSVVGLLLNSLMHHDKNLKGAARGVTTVLVELVKDNQQENGEMQLAVVRALITPPGSVRFDQLAGHKVLAEMMPHFTLKTLKGFTTTLLEMMNKPAKDLEVADRNYVAYTIGNLLSQPRTCLSSEAKTWKNQQLMAFLKAVILMPGKEGDTSKDAFFKILGKQLAHIKEYSVLLLNLVEEMDRELKAQEAAGSPSCLSGDGKEQWTQVISRLAALKEQQDAEGTETEVAKIIFQVLFCQMALHLFVDVTVATESITEFITCHREVKKLGMLKGDDDEDEECEDMEEERPTWVEVVTEMLLTLMTQEMHLFRTVVQGLFWLLTPVLTATALSLITDVLNTEKAQELVKKAGEEDDDDEDKEGSNEDDDEEDEENENEEEEDEDEDDELGEEDPNLFTLRNEMLDVAGAIDVDVDMDTVPQEELDRLDERLSVVMAEYRRKHPNRKRKKGRGGNDGPQLLPDEKSLMHFQTKVCDMLIVYIKAAPNMALQVGLVMPIYEALRVALLDERQKDLQNKLASVITTLGKKKKFNTVGEISVDSWKETVKEFFSIACQLPETFAPATKSCYSMLMQCGRSLLWMDEQAASQPDNFLTTTYVTHLETAFSKNHHVPNVVVFSEPCTYNMGGLWQVAATLVRLAYASKVKVHKVTQALKILQVLYSNKVLLDERSKPEAAAVEQDLFSKALEALGSKQVNGRFVAMLFSLLHTLLQVDQQTEPQHRLAWEELRGKVEALRERITKPILKAFRKEYNILNEALRAFHNSKERKTKQGVKRKAAVVNGGDEQQKNQVKKMKENNESNITNNSKGLSAGEGKGDKAKKKNQVKKIVKNNKSNTSNSSPLSAGEGEEKALDNDAEVKEGKKISKRKQRQMKKKTATVGAKTEQMTSSTLTSPVTPEPTPKKKKIDAEVKEGKKFVKRKQGQMKKKTAIAGDKAKQTTSSTLTPPVTPKPTPKKKKIAQLNIS